MLPLTEEQITQAKSIDLLTYLKTHEPSNLKQIGTNSYYTIQHSSLKISNGKWHWFSRGIGGKTALQYLIKVKGFDFIDAVKTINESPSTQPVQITHIEKKSFALPKAYTDSKQVIDYLKKRAISDEVINYCIFKNIIYESHEYHNAVFVGFDTKGIARYAALRGTRMSNPFKSEVFGSNKKYCFSIPPKVKSETLIVTESAIDALSVATLRAIPFNVHYLSLGGVYVPNNDGSKSKFPTSLSNYLETRPNINKVILCLDNDDVGRKSARFIGHTLSDQGYFVVDKPPEIGKDYNDLILLNF